MKNALRESLLQKLLNYITDNNPDLLLLLEEQDALSAYISGKLNAINDAMALLEDEPLDLQEEHGMALLTNDLRPSRYNYICRLLEEEFPAAYGLMLGSGILKFEAINLIGYCEETFDAMHFSERNEENRLLHYAIAGAISEYFDKSVAATENRASWATTATKN